jgi:quercetin dioxygenase-like cupin family protein
MKRMAIALPYLTIIGLLASCAPKAVSAGDPVQSDSKHYKVEFENNHIRVLRATYGPHEKSPMHSHPASVVIPLTGNNVREITGDGKTTAGTGGNKPFVVGSSPPQTHSLENLDDTVLETIIIELKDSQ